MMAAGGELMMLNRLLIVPGVEHAMLTIEFDLCLLLLRPRGSRVLPESHIMSAPGILLSTPPVHISGGRWETLKGHIFGVNWRRFGGGSYREILTPCLSV